MLGVGYEIALISYPLFLTTRHSDKTLTPFRAIFFALLRLPTIGLAILRIVSLRLSLQQPPGEPSQHATTALIMQIQMTYTVIGASLICIAFHPIAAPESPLLPTTTTTTRTINVPSTPPPRPRPQLPSSTSPSDQQTQPFDRSPKHHRPRSYFRFLRKKSTPDRPSAMHALQMSLSCDSAWTVTRAERGRVGGGGGVEYSLLNGSSNPSTMKKVATAGKDEIVVVSTVEVRFEESGGGGGGGEKEGMRSKS
jgi:hypothetical protein